MSEQNVLNLTVYTDGIIYTFSFKDHIVSLKNSKACFCRSKLFANDIEYHYYYEKISQLRPTTLTNVWTMVLLKSQQVSSWNVETQT